MIKYSKSSILLYYHFWNNDRRKRNDVVLSDYQIYSWVSCLECFKWNNVTLEASKYTSFKTNLTVEKFLFRLRKSVDKYCSKVFIFCRSLFRLLTVWKNNKQRLRQNQINVSGADVLAILCWLINLSAGSKQTSMHGNEQNLFYFELDNSRIGLTYIIIKYYIY